MIDDGRRQILSQQIEQESRNRVNSYQSAPETAQLDILKEMIIDLFIQMEDIKNEKTGGSDEK